MSVFQDLGFTFYLIKVIALVAVLLSTGELLYNYREYKTTGVFSWKIISSRVALLNNSLLYRVVLPFMKYPNFLYVLILRFVVILSLLTLPLPGWAEALGLGLVVMTKLLINYRSPYGQDGSDQMSTILFSVLFLYAIDKSNLIVAQAGVWFICLQTLLSYFTAGVAKAYGKKWTSHPVAVFQIFNTATYGYKPVARMLNGKKGIVSVLTWSTVAIECAFPVGMMLGVKGMLVFLVWGASFHLLNAVIMGLNAFLWAFLAAYPAVIYCAYQVESYFY